MNPPILSIENLTVDFKQGKEITRAVDNISLQVNRGEIVAIVGESGSGKSVTALSILQLLPRRQTVYPAGKILFRPTEAPAIDIIEQPESALRQIRGSAISMIFQEPMSALNPVYTCGNQLVEAIVQHRKCSKAKARLAALELFNKVKLPDPERIFRAYPHQISGGQKQRVMIAMAISSDPALLIADEPTTALDVTVQKNILDLLANLQAQTNMGMIFITHDFGVVRDIAHRVAVMYRGLVVEENTKDELFRNPQHPYTKALLNCRPILHAKGSRLPVVSDFWSPGNPEPEKFPEQAETIVPPANKIPEQSEAEPLLSVENLRVWFPQDKNIFGKTTRYLKAVDGLSFKVYKGETLGVVGESGSGKTTLGRALLRLIPATGGTIWHAGTDLLSLNREAMQELRKEIQIVFQDPYGSLNPRLRIGEAISEAMRVHKIAASKNERREKVGALLKKVNLRAEHYNRYPHAFSGGQRQRIGIARALALQPGFIIFDESVSALDVSVQAQVLNLINELKAAFGFTVLFISHDLGVVRYLSDRILVLKSGRMEEIGPAESVFKTPKSLYTRNLLDSIPGRGPDFL